MEKYDVVVIGAGPGGTPAAEFLAKKGKKVLLIDERGKPGGECLFEGCIPSKILETSADYFYQTKKLDIFGIDIEGNIKINWKNVIKRKEIILERRANAALHRLSQIKNFTFKHGKGSFISNNQIQIKKPDGSSETVKFEKAIIATGSSPFIPPIEGNGLDKIWTNRNIFDEEKLPESILIVGGGPIGIEFGQMFNKLGVKVIIVELMERILMPVDEEFALILQDKIQKDGIQLHLKSLVKRIDFENSRFKVTFEKEGTSQTVEVEKVLIAVGRKPNIESLNLEKVNVEYDRKGIITNEYYQTSNPDIYAVGDAIKQPKFQHLARNQGLTAARNILEGNKHTVNLDKLSWVLFSDPEIASAGLTEQQAKSRGIDYIVGKYPYQIDARAQIFDTDFGFLKFVVDKKNNQIIGVHIITEGASSLIGEASLIVANKLTLEQVANGIHPHPTLTESFELLAKNMLMQEVSQHV